MHRGLDAVRRRHYEFGYMVGPRGRVDFVREIPLEGLEAVRVGVGLIGLGACGLAWLAVLLWPSPPGTLKIPHGLARLAFGLYLASVAALLPPWRLDSPPILAFYLLHALVYGLWRAAPAIANWRRFSIYILVAALGLMFGIPVATIVAISRTGRDAGHDLGFALSAAMVSVFAIAAQAALTDRKRDWRL